MMSIAKKIQLVTRDIKQPAKTQKHPTKRFDYSSRDDLFAVVRQLLVQQELAFVHKLDLIAHERIHDTARGFAQYRAVVRLTVTIFDDTDSITSEWIGEGISSDETSIQSAATQAMRFFLINTFMLFDGEGEAQYGAQAPGETTKVVEPKPEGVAAQIAAYCGAQGLSDDETHRFLKYIQNSEKKRSIEQVPDAVLNNWLQKMKPLSTEDFCARVRKNINQRNAKDGEVKTASYEVGARQ